MKITIYIEQFLESGEFNSPLIQIAKLLLKLKAKQQKEKEREKKGDEETKD